MKLSALLIAIFLFYSNICSADTTKKLDADIIKKYSPDITKEYINCQCYMFFMQQSMLKKKSNEKKQKKFQMTAEMMEETLTDLMKMSKKIGLMSMTKSEFALFFKANVNEGMKELQAYQESYSRDDFVTHMLLEKIPYCFTITKYPQKAIDTVIAKGKD